MEWNRNLSEIRIDISEMKLNRGVEWNRNLNAMELKSW